MTGKIKISEEHFVCTEFEVLSERIYCCRTIWLYLENKLSFAKICISPFMLSQNICVDYCDKSTARSKLMTKLVFFDKN